MWSLLISSRPLLPAVISSTSEKSENTGGVYRLWGCVCAEHTPLYAQPRIGAVLSVWDVESEHIERTLMVNMLLVGADGGTG